jgi:uncharacterized protein YdeI (YjbR/CyaY-like superfamily)
MAQTDPRVNAYIERAAPFAQPLLAYLRKCVHEACPDVQEDIKWGMPFFVLGGRPLAHFAAFKAHCAFGFWQGRAVVDTGKEREAMGQFGRVTTRADLPGPREMKALVRAAVARIESEEAAPPAPKQPRVAKPLPAMPADLAAALAAVPGARERYDALSPTHRREYLEWVLEAKREATRQSRIQQAVARLSQGLPRYG